MAQQKGKHLVVEIMGLIPTRFWAFSSVSKNFTFSNVLQRSQGGATLSIGKAGTYL